MKKKLFSSIIILTSVVILFFAMHSTVSVNASDVVVSMQIDNPIMEINGQTAEIDEGRGTTPVVRNDRTIVPIRAIIEAFGGSVSYDGTTRTVTLNMNDDNIKLVIDSNAARLNGMVYALDTPPVIINDRTMLPMRFIAEGFNLGVAWDGSTRTVSIIRNRFDESEYERTMKAVPAYSGKPCVTLNNNEPYFKDYEIISGSFEYYSDLDELGRCDVSMASVATDLMPTKDRESISDVIPTGWINNSYDNVAGGYLYNRCHLIGFQLTGENANERNLITGTRYLNIEGMLPFENMIDDYVESTGNHVMYRVTPVFTGNNLVADGVLMEAYSVEDNGKGIQFCVYSYNVQPGIYIDYATGDNYAVEYTDNNDQGESNRSEASAGVYRTPTGKRYHFDAQCGGENSYEVTLDEALSDGLTPCKKCGE